MSPILLILAHRENRRLLAGWLEAFHPVALADSPQALTQPFDLCILDGPSLERVALWARGVRAAQQPAFLPFLLVTPREGVGMATRHLWEDARTAGVASLRDPIVDEVLISPVEKAELRARVETLLHTRRLSLENTALRKQLEVELARAGVVQATLLPRQPPSLPGFELAARCIPAREVGGDFYDWQEVSPGVLTFTLGDVAGKGMPAALLMATVQATLRAVALTHPPAVVLNLAQAALQTNFDRLGRFTTIFHARLDTGTRQLRYVDAGHGYAFIRRAGGGIETVRAGGLPLGIPQAVSYVEGNATLQPGDALVAFSDGLLEVCPDLKIDHRGAAGRLNGSSGAAEMVERLTGSSSRVEAPPDDLTVLVLRCVGE